MYNHALRSVAPSPPRRASLQSRLSAHFALALALALTVGIVTALLPCTPTAQAQQAPQTKGPAQGQAKLVLNQIQGGQWPTVTLNLTLTGPDGKAVQGLDAGHFEVIERGQTQAVSGLQVGPAKNVPLFVVLAIDVSGSMSADDKLVQARAAASAFIGTLGPRDAASIVAFNDQVREVVHSTTDRPALQAGLNTLQAGGNTAIYDGLYRCAQLAGAAPPGMRRVIILLTDGVDTSSKYSAAVAEDVAAQTASQVFTIGLGPDTNDRALTSLSEGSGGRYYKAPSSAQLAGIYAGISVELNSQVLLTYRSSTRVARSYELIRVEVRYRAQDGQTLSQVGGYRPPVSAVAVESSGPQAALTPPDIVAPPASVALPAAIVQPTQPGIPSATLIPFHWENWLAALLASFAVILGGVAVAVMLAPGPVSRRVDEYLARDREDEDAAHNTRGPGKRRGASVSLERLGRRLSRLSPTKYVELISELLVLLGPPYRMTMGKFLGIQFALTTLAGVLAALLVVRSESPSPMQALLSVAVAGGAGLYLPYFWLKRRVAQRQKAVLRALPGALDFLAINVEAGMGLDAALGQVVKRWHNTLTDEFGMLLVDFRIGKDRKDSWKDLIRRTRVPELTTFVTAMLQNEQVGISISTLLRTQADQMRVRRRQVAEESARTAPVKMLLPMVFFIFPGIFVIVLGPAIPQLLDTFTHVGR